MISPWKNPLPLEESSKNRVVVFFYSDRWIPMACFRLNEAIELHHKAMMRGKKIFVFPSGLDLETKNILAQESSALPMNWPLNSRHKFSLANQPHELMSKEYSRIQESEFRSQK